MVHPWKVKGFNIQIVNTRDKIQDIDVKNKSLIDAQVQVETIVKSQILVTFFLALNILNTMMLLNKCYSASKGANKWLSTKH